MQRALNLMIDAKYTKADINEITLKLNNQIKNWKGDFPLAYERIKLEKKFFGQNIKIKNEK